MTEIKTDEYGYIYREVSNNRRVYVYPITFGRARVAITSPGVHLSFANLW